MKAKCMSIDEILNNISKYQETEEQSEKRKEEWMNRRDD